MPKDWKELTDDDLLNYEGPLTAQIARYDRIMAKKMHDALQNVWGGLFDVKKAMHSSTAKIEARLTESEKIQRKAAAVTDHTTRRDYRFDCGHRVIHGCLHMDHMAIRAGAARGKPDSA